MFPHLFSRMVPVALRLALWLVLACHAPAAAGFGFDDVVREAEALSHQAYRPAPPLPAALAALSYDDDRRIRFRAARSLWRDAGLPFEVQFFALGRGFTQPLRLMEVVDGQPRPLRVPASDFIDAAVRRRASFAVARAQDEEGYERLIWSLAKAAASAP